MGDLEARVVERLPDDGWTERDLERAISTVEDHGLTGEEAVEAGVRRVCLVAGLDPDAAADAGEEVFGSERARQAEPYVRQLREEVFGSPDPPFDSVEDDDAVAWETERFRRAMLTWTQDQPAVHVDPPQDPTRPTPEHQRLQKGIRELGKATGFRESDVVRWVYTGQRPPLSRSYVRTNAIKRELPDGTWMRRKEARIVFHAPTSREEVLRAWRRVSAFFEANGIPDRPMEGRTRGPKVTDLDRHLWRLMEEMPEKGDATWPERAEAWAALDPPDGWTKSKWSEHRDVSPDALRVRWKRLQDKLNRLDLEQED